MAEATISSTSTVASIPAPGAESTNPTENTETDTTPPDGLQQLITGAAADPKKQTGDSTDNVTAGVDHESEPERNNPPSVRRTQPTRRAAAAMQKTTEENSAPVAGDGRSIQSAGGRGRGAGKVAARGGKRGRGRPPKQKQGPVEQEAARSGGINVEDWTAVATGAFDSVGVESEKEVGKDAMKEQEDEESVTVADMKGENGDPGVVAVKDHDATPKGASDTPVLDCTFAVDDVAVVDKSTPDGMDIVVDEDTNGSNFGSTNEQPPSESIEMVVEAEANTGQSNSGLSESAGYVEVVLNIDGEARVREGSEGSGAAVDSPQLQDNAGPARNETEDCAREDAEGEKSVELAEPESSVAPVADAGSVGEEALPFPMEVVGATEEKSVAGVEAVVAPKAEHVAAGEDLKGVLPIPGHSSASSQPSVAAESSDGDVASLPLMASKIAVVGDAAMVAPPRAGAEPLLAVVDKDTLGGDGDAKTDPHAVSVTVGNNGDVPLGSESETESELPEAATAGVGVGVAGEAEVEKPAVNCDVSSVKNEEDIGDTSFVDVAVDDSVQREGERSGKFKEKPSMAPLAGGSKTSKTKDKKGSKSKKSSKSSTDADSKSAGVEATIEATESSSTSLKPAKSKSKDGKSGNKSKVAKVVAKAGMKAKMGTKVGSKGSSPRSTTDKVSDAGAENAWPGKDERRKEAASGKVVKGNKTEKGRDRSGREVSFTCTFV